MDAFIATILPFAATFAPKNWADCQGQLINISSNTALFALLGTTYGGNGTTTFALPDLRGRVIVGIGQGGGLSNYAQGQLGGTENVTLTTAQLPAHNHPLTGSFSLQVSKGLGTHDIPNAGDYLGTVVESGGTNANAYTATAGTTVALGGFSGSGATVGMTGNNQPHSNMQPYLALRYIICLYGIFPPRS
jgi:microcystin-dependent protein